MFPAYPYVGQIFGDYKLLKGIGHGGFADVYLAEHVALGKKVAVKVLNTKLANDSEIQNFKREARVIVALEHPHIIEVYHLGEYRRIPFIAMRYSPQGSLRDRHPRGTIVPLETVVKYVKQVAEALQYVHDKGLIHRDVKPHNMLLDQYGSILLSDFGIAIMTDSRRSNPQDFAGTAEYMAPEQALNKAVRVSDQYALAITVYEWLTGDVPFHGANFVEITAKHTLNLPPSMRSEELRGNGIEIPSKVEQVVMKALAKDPKERYPNVTIFADALEKAVEESREIVHILSRRDYGQENIIFSVSWSPDDRYLAAAGFNRSVSVIDVSKGQSVLAYQHDNPREQAALDDEYVQFNSVYGVAFSPNGLYLASAGSDNIVRVMEFATGNRILTYAHESWAMSVAWSPDSRYIASGGDDERVCVTELVTGTQVWINQQPFGFYIDSIDWSPDGQYLAMGGQWEIRVFKSLTGQKVLKKRMPDPNTRAKVSWSPDSSKIAVVTGREAYILELITGKWKCIRKFSSEAFSVAWSPDGNYIATGHEDGTLSIINTVTEKVVLTFSKGDKQDIAAIAWSHNSKYIALGGMTNPLIVLQVR